MAFLIQDPAPPFDADFIVLGVMAQLFAGLFLAFAAGKGNPRHLLLESLGGTPRNLNFLRDAIHARVRSQAGAVFLLAGAGLLLTGILAPGPPDWKVRAGGMLLQAVVALAFLTLAGPHVERTLRRYVRQHLSQHSFAFEDHIPLTREIGDLFGVPGSPEDTLESYVAKVRTAVGLAQEAPSGLYRRPSTRAAVR